MKRLSCLSAIVALGATAAAAAALPSVHAMQDHRRILLVASPSPQDPKAILQRRIVAEWDREAADRDVSLVEISGSHVAGASDSAAALRGRYRLDPAAFQVLLIGKDGHVARRSAQPIDAGTLQATIDAMPMRQAGGR